MKGGMCSARYREVASASGLKRSLFSAHSLCCFSRKPARYTMHL